MRNTQGFPPDPENLHSNGDFDDCGILSSFHC